MNGGTDVKGLTAALLRLVERLGLLLGRGPAASEAIPAQRPSRAGYPGGGTRGTHSDAGSRRSRLTDPGRAATKQAAIDAARPAQPRSAEPPRRHARPDGSPYRGGSTTP